MGYSRARAPGISHEPAINHNFSFAKPDRFRRVDHGRKSLIVDKDILLRLWILPRRSPIGIRDPSLSDRIFEFFYLFSRRSSPTAAQGFSAGKVGGGASALLGFRVVSGLSVLQLAEALYCRKVVTRGLSRGSGFHATAGCWLCWLLSSAKEWRSSTLKEVGFALPT